MVSHCHATVSRNNLQRRTMASPTGSANRCTRHFLKREKKTLSRIIVVVKKVSRQDGAVARIATLCQHSHRWTRQRTGTVNRCALFFPGRRGARHCGDPRQRLAQARACVVFGRGLWMQERPRRHDRRPFEPVGPSCRVSTLRPTAPTRGPRKSTSRCLAAPSRSRGSLYG